MVEDTDMVKLVTEDGVDYELEYKLVKHCKLVERIADDGEIDEKIPLKDVKKVTFDKIVQFCQHLVEGNDPPVIHKPLRSNKLADLTTEFYAGFVDGLGEEELFEVVLASNYLECQHLLELSSAKVATLIQHMDVDQVREFFAIENDFTPIEMERVKQEIKWAEATFQ